MTFDEFESVFLAERPPTPVAESFWAEAPVGRTVSTASSRPGYWLVVVESGELPEIEFHERWLELQKRVESLQRREVRVMAFRGVICKVVHQSSTDKPAVVFERDAEQPEEFLSLFHDDSVLYRGGYLGVLEDMIDESQFEAPDLEVDASSEEESDDEWSFSDE